MTAPFYQQGVAYVLDPALALTFPNRLPFGVSGDRPAFSLVLLMETEADRCVLLKNRCHFAPFVPKIAEFCPVSGLFWAFISIPHIAGAPARFCGEDFPLLTFRSVFACVRMIFP